MFWIEAGGLGLAAPVLLPGGCAKATMAAMANAGVKITGLSQPYGPG